MKTTTFLTFVNEQSGKAAEAIEFYTTTFPNSEVLSIVNYKEGEHGGTPELVKVAAFTLNGAKFMISENNYNHAWSITPGVSIFVDCDTEEETEFLFEQLWANGKVMIPLGNYQTDNYGFGKKFGWCEDKFGVSWQINLAT